MEWLNLKTSVLHAPEFIGQEPRERATWLSVCLWCAEQENGGRIKGAKAWKDRQWQQTCGVTRREVEAASELLTWDGDDVLVWNYPTDKENLVRQRREFARLGGIQSGIARQPNAEANASPHASTESKQMLQANAEANASSISLNGIGIGRGIGKGKEEGSFAFETEIPAELNTPAFLAAWSDYLAFRRERRLPKLIPRSQAAQLAKMARWGCNAAIQSIRETIAQGWQGLFEPKGGNLARGTPPPPPAEAPRYSDEGLRLVAQKNPGLLMELTTQWPKLAAQAARLGLIPPLP